MGNGRVFTSQNNTISYKTNTTANSCETAECSCEVLWSLTQEFCFIRLSEEKDMLDRALGRTYNFIDNLEVRARRIAATYARFYLETEEHGNTSKKGRYYWMALGAFASKTVACTLEHLAMDTLEFLTPEYVNWFGQGNFWLFQDIAGWHYYYSMLGSDSFETCVEKRDTRKFVPAMKKAVEQAPWSGKSLHKINYLKSNNYVKQGFSAVKEFETTPTRRKTARESAQFDNLMRIAEHEQGEILQPLIYDDFATKVDIYAMDLPVINWFTPTVALYFTSACETNIEKYTSLPPEDTTLYDYESRMTWITKAAEQFHRLMKKEKSYMESQLRNIASWVNMQD